MKTSSSPSELWRAWMGDNLSPQDFARMCSTAKAAVEAIEGAINSWHDEHIAEEAIDDPDAEPAMLEARWQEASQRAREVCERLLDETLTTMKDALNEGVPPGWHVRLGYDGAFRFVHRSREKAGLDYGQAEALLHIMEKGNFDPSPRGFKGAIADAMVVAAGTGKGSY